MEAQLATKQSSWGSGKTLVFSMLTDGFSPTLVDRGTTRKALELLLRTSFRIRILTKNAIVGSDHWIEFFRAYPGRFVVGLSTGTLDDRWAAKIELGTSRPSARVAALQKLQDAGVPTFGMLCPIDPDVLQGEHSIELLLDGIRPERCEHVWAEPFNDRQNWQAVRAGYTPGTYGHQWLTRVYERREGLVWSEYATNLYTRLHTQAVHGGWIDRLRYLLYERQVLPQYVEAFAIRRMEGVLLQGKTNDEGISTNPGFAYLQQALLRDGSC